MKHFGNPKNENLLRSLKFYGENEFPVKMCRSQLITEILSFFFHNFERKIGHEIFVKTEKTEYLSNQLTYAHFDRKFIFPNTTWYWAAVNY